MKYVFELIDRIRIYFGLDPFGKWDEDIQLSPETDDSSELNT